MNPRHFAALLLLTGLALLPLWMNGGLPQGSDIPIHYWRTAELDHLWASGQIIPRWSEHFFYGYGYPFFQYYGAGGYALAVLIGKMPGVDDVLRLRLMWAAGILAASTGVFLYGSRRWGAQAGLVSAASMIFAPALIWGEPIARGSPPVALAMGLWALSLGLLDSVAASRRHMIPAALGIAALIWTHNVTAALGIVVLMGWLVWAWIFARADMPHMGAALLTLIMGIGLAGFFLVPLILEHDLVTLDRLYAGENLDYRNHFQSPGALLGITHRFDARVIGQPTIIPLGIAAWALALVGMGFVHKQREMVYWGIVAVVTVFFVTPYSLPLWELLSPLRLLQFPTRLLNVTALALALLGGFAFDQVPRGISKADRSRAWLDCGRLRRPRAGARYTNISLAAILILLAAQGLHSTPWNWTREFPAEATPAGYFAYELETNQRGTTGTNEFLPVSVSIPPAPSDFLLDSLRGDGPAQRINRDDLRIAQIESGPTRYDFTVTSEQPTELEIFLFYFPGWRGWVDDEQVEIGPVGEHGFIGINVPAGTHRVDLRYGSTFPRQLGLLTSIACALILVGWTWISRQQRTGIPQNDELNNRQLLIVAAVTIVAAIGGLVYLREGVGWTASEPGQANLAEHPMRLHFGDSVTLLGYDIEEQPHQLQVALYWTFDESAAPDINAFVHLLNPSGQIVAQHDKANFSQVVDYAWWDDALHLRDLFIIDLPDDMPYRIRVGLWRDDGERLEIFTEDGESLGEVLFLDDD